MRNYRSKSSVFSGMFGVALASTLTLGSVGVGAQSVLSPTPFTVGDPPVEAVWGAVAQEGVSGTDVVLLSTADGTTVNEVASVDGDLNGLGFWDAQRLLVGVVDEQFVDTIPVNNEPTVVTIGENGVVAAVGQITPPAGALGGTVLSYAGDVEGDTYYVLGLQYDMSGFTPVTRIVLGTYDLVNNTTVWSSAIDFSGDAACQTQVDEFRASILAGQVPTAFITDFVVVDGQLISVLSGGSGDDLIFQMDVGALVPTCTSIGADVIPGSSGGVAVDVSGNLVAMSLEDGSLWNVTEAGATSFGSVAGSNLRGDLAANTIGASVAEETGSLVVAVQTTALLPVDGVTVRLSRDGVVVAEVTSTVDGIVSFSNVEPGTYSLSHAGRSGYVATVAIAGESGGSVVTESEIAEIELGAGQDVTGYVFVLDPGSAPTTTTTTVATTTTSGVTTSTSTTAATTSSTTLSSTTTSAATSSTTSTVAPVTSTSSIAPRRLAQTGVESNVLWQIAGLLVFLGGALVGTARSATRN